MSEFFEKREPKTVLISFRILEKDLKEINKLKKKYQLNKSQTCLGLIRAGIKELKKRTK